MPAKDSPSLPEEKTSAEPKTCRLSSLPRGKTACYVSCTNPILAMVLMDRGLRKGCPLRLCWRASMGGALCIEAAAARYIFSPQEAHAIHLTYA